MNYGNIIYNDIANGTGVRTSLFVSGCRNNCPGCFNKEAQDFSYGEPFTYDIEKNIFDSVDNEYIAGITILGGEPLDPENANFLLPMIKRFRERFGSDKTIWVYTGYQYEELLNLDITDARRQILAYIDVLVDGRFEMDKRDITLKFRGSSNQRIIELNK